jgi:hypothetical protein
MVAASKEATEPRVPSGWVQVITVNCYGVCMYDPSVTYRLRTAYPFGVSEIPLSSTAIVEAFLVSHLAVVQFMDGT